MMVQACITPSEFTRFDGEELIANGIVFTFNQILDAKKVLLILPHKKGSFTMVSMAQE